MGDNITALDRSKDASQALAAALEVVNWRQAATSRLVEEELRAAIALIPNVKTQSDTSAEELARLTNQLERIGRAAAAALEHIERTHPDSYVARLVVRHLRTDVAPWLETFAARLGSSV